MESLAIILYLIGSFGAIITYLFTPTIIIYEKDKKKRNLILGFTTLLIISLIIMPNKPKEQDIKTNIFTTTENKNILTSKDK
ncbi:hypothetical protein [Clostridium senegalense]|uniref:hypothetical protein n=1 Tax=Clostridium senegalense TaxID=1465809 RepID=UPI000289147A|nr:hypothetical protein [Clostridium senegalense]